MREVLHESELTKIHGGSSDIFWTRYGVGLAAGSKCESMIGSALGKAGHVICGARAVYAAIRG